MALTNYSNSSYKKLLKEANCLLYSTIHASMSVDYKTIFYDGMSVKVDNMVQLFEL